MFHVSCFYEERILFMYISRFVNFRRARFISGFFALMVVLLGLLELSSVPSAQAATLSTATTAQPGAHVAITNVRRISATAVRVTFTTPQDYTSYAMRYSEDGGGWSVLRVGHPGRPHVIVVVVRLPRRLHHHFVFEACGLHGNRFDLWSGSYHWNDD
jgi:hypothetical protein